MSGTLTISGMSAGLPSGQQVIGPVTDTGTNTIGQTIDATLGTGDNTFAVASGAVRVAVFIPAGGYTATLKIRTNLNSGDGGLPVGPYAGTGWMSWPLPAGTTSVILNSTGSVANVEVKFI